MALEELTALPTILGLKCNPTIDSTGFNTDHVLVSILGIEITNSLSLLLPRVPDDRVLEVVSDDVEARLVVDEDGGGVLLERLVHAVHLAFETKLVTSRVVLGLVENLVNILHACQTGHLDLGDVLPYN